MSYDDRMWDFCYNTAYIVLGKDKANFMLNALKDLGGPHGFVLSTKEDFKYMMSDVMKENDEVCEIVKEYIEAIEKHNSIHLDKMKRKYLSKQSRLQIV